VKGTFTIESKVNHGTKILARVPFHAEVLFGPSAAGEVWDIGGTKMERIRILLADDHSIVSAGLRKMLESHYEIVGCVENGIELVRVAKELRPNVVILDIAMPLLNGLDAARLLKKLLPQVKLIFLTMNSDSDIAAEALRVGASAYLLKTSKAPELLQAVHDVLRGVSYVTPQIRDAMEQTFIRDPRAQHRPKQLTGRQREVLQMLAEGRPMKEIAYLLHISHRTVRFHKSGIMEELSITTNSELVQYAIKHGIISSL
jgi:DNA-binding NarL/FixJ family response regulator